MDARPRLDPLRLALGLWLAVALAAAGRTLLRPDKHTVYPVFAAAAGRWWADESLYGKGDDLDHYRYPPAFAVALTPLAGLGLRAGGVLWAWLSMGTLLAGLGHFARHALPGEWPRRRLAAFLTLALLVALRGLWNGQSNALAVGLLLLGGAELARRRWWSAALLLAASVGIKLTPIAPVLLLCALWPGRLAPRVGVALALVGLVPFLTRPPDVVAGQYREWAAHLAGSGSERWPGFRDAWTVWQALRHTLDGTPVLLKEPLDSPAYRAVQLLTAAGALAWCLWLKRRGAPRAALVHAALAVGGAWLLLFGPAVEHATFVFLAAPLAWAVVERGAWPRGRRLIGFAAGLILVLGWGGLTRPWADEMPLLLTALPVGTGLFVVWLIGYGANGQGSSSASKKAPMRDWASAVSLSSGWGASVRKPCSRPS